MNGVLYAHLCAHNDAVQVGKLRLYAVLLSVPYDRSDRSVTMKLCVDPRYFLRANKMYCGFLRYFEFKTNLAVVVIGGGWDLFFCISVCEFRNNFWLVGIFQLISVRSA